ncbi:hypothetical protein [Microbaculum sp. FT89]|uniref:hypothetical protein n=1 Tax=Microbaculum sp. FT89 TaxID=3447298 RepID=UPI003F535412
MNGWVGWPQEEELRNLLLRFFLDFARFEFAMKTGGFGVVLHGAYQPSWRALKAVMKGRPLPDGLKAECQYVWDRPPNKQTDRYEWRPVEPRDDWAFVIDCVKTVRNNLFHGGKVPFRPNRDPELIRQCDRMLMALVAHGPEGVALQFEAAER